MVQLAPTCDICEKRVSVPLTAFIGGMILGVCDDCLKYGERVKITEVDRINGHCILFECFWIGSE